MSILELTFLEEAGDVIAATIMELSMAEIADNHLRDQPQVARLELHQQEACFMPRDRTANRSSRLLLMVGATLGATGNGVVEDAGETNRDCRRLLILTAARTTWPLRSSL